MGLHTPSHEDKIPAFCEGYRAIQEYIAESPDDVDKKIAGVALAVEALVIWTHPFNDGNGRTSRFLAKLIEEGATDIDSLVNETSSNRIRRRTFNQKVVTRESVLENANNEDMMFDDDEREEMRQQAETLPSDIEGMYTSVRNLLYDDALQQRTRRR